MPGEFILDQLSNYELLALLTAYSSDAGSHFMNFLAFFSAYLVAAYLVADKIGRTTLLALSALYLVVVAMTASGSYVTLCGAIDIANEVSARNIVGAPHLRSTADLLSGNAGGLIVLMNPVVEIVACAGSILFAFRHRTHSTNSRASN
jgi:hypothetical protein